MECNTKYVIWNFCAGILQTCKQKYRMETPLINEIIEQTPLKKNCNKNIMLLANKKIKWILHLWTRVEQTLCKNKRIEQTQKNRMDILFIDKRTNTS